MSESAITVVTGADLRVGDLITIPNPFRPKWWQFWKRWPFRRVRTVYRCIAVTSNQITID